MAHRPGGHRHQPTGHYCIYVIISRDCISILNVLTYLEVHRPQVTLVPRFWPALVSPGASSRPRSSEKTASAKLSPSSGDTNFQVQALEKSKVHTCTVQHFLSK